MTEKEKAREIVDRMFEHDAFSQWLGIQRLKQEVGYCLLQMTVRPEMLNGFGIAHGGITFSLADSALAFACNSTGRKAVSIETSIAHTAPVKSGDTITAEAVEESRGNRIAHYKVTVKNQDDAIVGLFKGIVYRKGETWAFN